MALLDVEFEWPVCVAGYEITYPKAEEPQESKIVTVLTETSEDIAPYISAKGQNERLELPFKYHPTLYVDFAKLDGSPESCLGFAKNFGLLGTNQMGGSEHLEFDWLFHIRGMAEVIKLSQTNPLALKDRLNIAPLQGSLVQSPPDGRLVFRFRPSSLLHGMLLQFAQAISSGLDIKDCRYCGKWFEVGGDQRRRDATFCSRKCKIDFHNQEKRRTAQ